MATNAENVIPAFDVQTLKVETPASNNLVVVADRQLALAKTYKITSPQLYVAAAEDLQIIKGKIKAWDDERKSITKPIDEAKEKVMNLFRGPIATLQSAEKVIKDGLNAWDDEQERIRKAQEDELRRQQQAEQQRIAQEAEDARKALESASTPEQVAEAAAKVEQAVERQAEIEHAPAAIVTSATPKVAGISRKTNWRGECTDKMALIKAVAEGKAPITLLDVNDSVLNQMARAMKETMSYPGCRAVEEKGIASSRR